MDLGHGDRWRLDPCTVCPAQTLPAGTFDTSDRPGPATRYDPTAGHRINRTTGRPECVHPFRVQTPGGHYASADNGLAPARRQPADVPLQPPAEVVDLEAWFIATLRREPVESKAAALADAEATAKQQFPAQDVTAAMRRALADELTRGVLVRQQSHHPDRF
jgi:hypothetical protein